MKIEYVLQNGERVTSDIGAAASGISAMTGITNAAAWNRLRRYPLDAQRLYAPVDIAHRESGKARRHPKLTDLCAELDARKRAMKEKT